VANWYYSATITIPPPPVGFMVAVPVLSVLSLAYLEAAPRFAPKAAHPHAMFIVEVMNALFYFAGFIALAVFLGKLRFCRGSVCEAAKANAGLSAIQFLVWGATAGLCGMGLFRGGFKKDGFKKDAVKIDEVPMKEAP
jgi:hypothetical protein